MGKRNLWLIAIGAALNLIPSTVLPQDKPRSLVQTYLTHASFSITLCQFAVSGARAQAELEARGGRVPEGAPRSEPPEKCVRDQEDAAKPLLRAAAATLKQSSKKNALSAFHAAYVTALRGLLPGSGETVGQYNARQAALKDKLATADAMLVAEGVE